MVDITPPFTVASPAGGTYLENTVITLTPYTDSLQTSVDSGASVFWQRYVQSAESVYDVTTRWNLAGMNPDCIHVRFFDPDNRQVPLFTSPGECDNIAVPIANNTTALQEAYDRGDFSIMLNGCDAVDDMGFTIKSLFQDNGDPIPFTDYRPGNIYVNPEVGMFMFFHFPDKWDACSYWDFSWWDNGGLPASVLSKPPYVTNWDTVLDTLQSVLSITRLGATATVTTVGNHGFVTGDTPGIVGADQPEYNGTHIITFTGPTTFTYTVSGTPTTPATGTITTSKGIPIPFTTPGCEWDGQVIPGWAEANWDDLDNPIPINTYWDTVSEAPAEGANVIVCYWTQDNTNPLEQPDDATPLVANSYRSHLFTSPITVTTLTQLRFRGVDAIGNIENTKIELYETGLQLPLVKGVNLISQPRVLTPTEANLSTLFSGVNLLQIYRVENGLWQVFIPNSGVLNDFDKIDNQHGFFVIMNGPDTFCIPYGELPTTTTLTVVDKDTNQKFSAIGVPRKSTADNSIANLLDSRAVQFEELFRVTNNVFETYIPTRAPVLNFNPADLTPGRGYGVVTSTAQVFELPFID